VQLKLQSVYRYGESWNEPAVTIDAYAPEDAVEQLFSQLILEWPSLIAVISRTSWGIRTVFEMTDDFPANPFVYGKTFLATQVAPPRFLDAFQSRFGADSVKRLPTGFLLSRSGVPWWRKGHNDEEDRVYVFFEEGIGELATHLYESRPSHAR
jgi:hypothetical protein